MDARAPAGPTYTLTCDVCGYTGQFTRNTGQSLPEECPDCNAPRDPDAGHPRNDRVCIFTDK